MPKYTKTTVTQLSANEQAALDQINKNFEDIQSAIADTVSRSGAIPSHMTNDLDMNGKRIINVPTPKTENDLVRQKDVVGDIATVQQLVNTTTNAAAQTLEAAQAVQEIMEDSHITLVADDLALGEDSNIVQVANNKTNIDTVAGSISNVNTVGTDIANVNTVASNTTNINTVAGISSDVTTVAGLDEDIPVVVSLKDDIPVVVQAAEDIDKVEDIAADITTVAGISTDVSTVASNSTDVSTVADNVSDVSTVASNISNVNAVGTISSDVTTVAGISSNVTAVAGNTANITAVAGNATNINAVNANKTNIDAVAGNATNINAVNSNKTNIDTVAGSVSDISTVATNISDVSTVATNVSDVSDVADNISDIGTVATDISNINSVASDLTNIDSVAGDLTNIDAVNSNKTNINAVAGNSSNINAVAGNATNINAVNANKTNIDTVSGISSNVTTVAGISSSVSTVAGMSSNIASVVSNATNINSVAGDLTNINAVAADLTNIDAASSYAAESKQWAIGYPTEPSDGSAKYWAAQASAGQLQADWNQSDNTKKDYIKNKPNYGASLSYSSNTLQLKDQNGNNLGSSVTIQSSPDIDELSITKNGDDELQTVGVIDQRDTTTALKQWSGTKAQYDAIVSKDANTIYNVTDEPNTFQSLLETIYPVGSIYIGTTPVCPMSALLGTWTLVGTKLVTNVDSTAGVKGNGMTLGLTDGANTSGFWINSVGGSMNNTNAYGTAVGSGISSATSTLNNMKIGLTTDPTKSGIEATVASSSLTVNLWQRTA